MHKYLNGLKAEFGLLRDELESVRTRIDLVEQLMDVILDKVQKKLSKVE